jgi:hypothetical protein
LADFYYGLLATDTGSHPRPHHTQPHTQVPRQGCRKKKAGECRPMDETVSVAMLSEAARPKNLTDLLKIPPP